MSTVIPGCTSLTDPQLIDGVTPLANDGPGRRKPVFERTGGMSRSH